MKRNSANQELLVELWRFLERHGIKPSIAMVCRMLRDAGLTVQNNDAYRWLAPFAKKAESLRMTGGETAESVSRINGEIAEKQRRDGGPPSRAHGKVSLFPESRIPSSKTSSSRAATRVGLPKPVSAEETRARELLAAIWSLVAPHIGTVMTQKAWRDRNKRYALEMAEAGLSVDAVVAAQRAASERTGKPVYWVKIIHDEITRGAIRQHEIGRVHDIEVRYSSNLEDLR